MAPASSWPSEVVRITTRRSAPGVTQPSRGRGTDSGGERGELEGPGGWDRADTAGVELSTGGFPEQAARATRRIAGAERVRPRFSRRRCTRYSRADMFDMSRVTYRGLPTRA